MKTVRNSVFETNSSTQHSLTFAFGTENEDLKSIIGGDVLKFGVRTEEEIRKTRLDRRMDSWYVDIDSTFSWQDRADILFKRLIKFLSTSKFLIVQEKIRRMFEKRGIKVEFLIKENLDYLKEIGEEFIDDYDHDEDIYQELLDDSCPEFEEQIINFIFSPHILEYTFCDDCVSPERHKEVWNRLDELMSSFPKNAMGFQKSVR